MIYFRTSPDDRIPLKNKVVKKKIVQKKFWVQCDQCRETNIGDRSYERTKLKLKNRALWVAREFHEVFPMMIFVCQVFRLCEKMAIARSHCIGSIRCIK